jgi:hypothetical protein
MKSSHRQRCDIEPALIRHLPFLSRRRIDVLQRLLALLDPEVVENVFTRDSALSRVVIGMSSRTLELLVDTFALNGINAVRFLRSVERYGESESETRALLSYWDTLTDLSLHQLLLDSTTPACKVTRSAVQSAFTAAQSQHPDFMIDDVSVLTGESRAKFAAMLTLFASTITGANSHVAMIPRDITGLLMSRPESALNIVNFQRSLAMPFEDLDATLVQTFLDNPSPALSSGLL